MKWIVEKISWLFEKVNLYALGWEGGKNQFVQNGDPTDLPKAAAFIFIYAAAVILIAHIIKFTLEHYSYSFKRSKLIWFKYFLAYYIFNIVAIFIISFIFWFLLGMIGFGISFIIFIILLGVDLFDTSINGTFEIRDRFYTLAHQKSNIKTNIVNWKLKYKSLQIHRYV